MISASRVDNAIPDAAEGASGPPQRVERLEYGKFTDGFGTVEKMEHAVLASSRAWPPDLLPFCGPRIVGPSLEDNDRLPRWAGHGTILQPVCTDRVWTLWSRVMPIPEGRSNRPYQRARFAVSDPQTQLAAVFAAIDRMPLEELVRDGAEELPALELEPQVGGLRILDRFAESVLPYILAGIPVAISEEIAEEEFFGLADRLWGLLPPPLRNVFSAGWGMGLSQQGRVSFSAGMTAGPGVARLWRDSDGEWQIQYPELRDQAIDKSLGMARLFLKLTYPTNEDGRRVDQNRMATALRLLGTWRLPQNTLLTANLLWVRETLRTCGQAAYDMCRIDQVTAEVESGKPAPDVEALLDDLWIPESFSMCVEAVVAQLERPDTLRPAMQQLIAWLQQNPEKTDRAIAAWTGPGRHAAAHLRVNLKRSALDVLRELLDSNGGAVPWDELRSYSAGRVLVGSLNELSAEEVELHDKLLERTWLPEPYQLFLERCEWEFLLRADRILPDKTADRIINLRRHRLGRGDACECLAHMAKSTSGPQSDPRERLTPQERIGLSECVVRRFDKLKNWSGERKNYWLAWACPLVPAGQIVLLDAYRCERANKQFPLSAEDAKELCKTVSAGQVPPEARKQLALLVRRELGLFVSDLLAAGSAWRWLKEFWPEEDLLFFLDLSDGVGERLPDDLKKLPGSDLDKVFRFWATSETVKSRSRKAAVPLLLEYTRFHFSPLWTAPLIWLCRDIIRDNASFAIRGRQHSDPVIDGDVISLAAALFGLLPPELRRGFLPIREHALWDNATSGLGLLLLLLLYPHSQFMTSRKQVELLSKVQPELERHSIGSKQEDRGIQLAAAGFHTLDYEKSYDWFPEIKNELWAAFYGMPVKKQGDLGSALRHYGPATPDQIKLCHTYLKKAYEKEKAADKVLKEFATPLLNSSLSAHDVQQFLAAASRGSEADLKLARIEGGESLLWLVQTAQQVRMNPGVYA